ncbi:hypothetical protein OPAG_08272 [Rhodococcus opacus PD630]|nr:hypothetical protein OPAG_08272 [Rhodococcus opacus PD630]
MTGSTLLAGGEAHLSELSELSGLSSLVFISRTVLLRRRSQLLVVAQQFSQSSLSERCHQRYLRELDAI